MFEMLENCNPSSYPNNYLYYYSYPLPLSSRISRNHSANVLVDGIVMAIDLANGKAYYNAYNFAIGIDPAEPAFAPPTSTAILILLLLPTDSASKKKH